MRRRWRYVSWRDLAVHLVYWAGHIPLYLLVWALDRTATILAWMGNALDDVRLWWKRRTRVWAGLTPEGWTPAQVAEREARRAETLERMRAERGQPMRPLFPDPDSPETPTP